MKKGNKVISLEYLQNLVKKQEEKERIEKECIYNPLPTLIQPPHITPHIL